MDKHELVELTIERLIANFESSPESFELKEASSGSYGGTCVTWRPKIASNYDSIAIDDPNNSHAIVVQINSISLEIVCNLFIKTPLPFSLESSKADKSVGSLQNFQTWRRTYRLFYKLVRLIKARNVQRDNMDYLSKLSSVFPDTFDKHILKD